MGPNLRYQETMAPHQLSKSRDTGGFSETGFWARTKVSKQSGEVSSLEVSAAQDFIALVFQERHGLF